MIGKVCKTVERTVCIRDWDVLHRFLSNADSKVYEMIQSYVIFEI